MNFLLHHAFAYGETGSSLAAVGAMLPDFWRMVHPRVRARASVVSDAVGGALDLGIAHHLAVDAWFHATDVFRCGEKRLATELRAVSVPKLGLFAHVAWELCLDGAWVRHIDPLPVLRDGWTRAGDAVERLAEDHGVARLDAVERARFHGSMRRVRDGLLEGEWIRGYADGDGLAERVESMRTRRFGMPPLDRAARSQVKDALVRASERADGALEALFVERARGRVGSP